MKPIPIYVKIYEQFKEMINEGIYQENQKLPSKRKLADAFQVSPLTIEAAYQQLIAEGYVYALEKKGYYVDKQIQLLKTKKYLKKSEIVFESSDLKDRYMFKTNAVDTSIFPNATWSKLSREVLSNQYVNMLNDIDPKGLFELRIEIQKYLETYRSMRIDPSQIIIGSGSTPLIQLLIEILGRKKHYAIENPCYDRIYKVLKGNDVRLSLIPLDESGISLEALETTKAEVIHITPSHQFPMGIVMPIQRRRELLNWSLKTGGYIIEDDYDSEFRYSGKPIPSLMGLSPLDHVIYMNTFTKTLAPSFRIGYIVLPKHLLTMYQELSSYHGCTVPNFEQYILAEFMKQGHFERHLNKMRKWYQKKLDKIIQLMETESIFTLKGHESGLHFLLEIKKEMNVKDLIAYLNEQSIFLHDLSSYYKNQTTTTYPILVLGYAGIFDDAIENNFTYLINAIKRYITFN